MAVNANFLTDAEAHALKVLLQDYLGNTDPKRHIPRVFQLGGSPDIYIAKIPDGGIPGLDRGTDTGTGDGDPPLPGSASCQIYKQIVPRGTQQVELVYAGQNKTVYNLSLGPIRGQSWLEVKRTKFGMWYANPLTTIRRWAYTTENLTGGTLNAPQYTVVQLKKMNFSTGVFSSDGPPVDAVHAWAHEIPVNTLCRVEMDEEYGRWSIYAVNCEAD